MKARFLCPSAIALVFSVSASDLAAQDIQGGTVKYQQVKKHDFKKVFAGFIDEDNSRAKEWIASLPTESKRVKVLHFTKERALYEEDPKANEALPRNLQGALARAAHIQPPQSELMKVYCDFGKNKKTEEISFMTRPV